MRRGVMRRFALISWFCLCCVAQLAAGGDRLAVLEFFGRPTGGYCSAAGPAMRTLQSEMEGRAVLLEYDYDRFRDGRLARFWATGAQAAYLPLVMVGSGYRTTSGPDSYYNVYSGMLAAELQRPPRADVKAYWRRAGSRVVTYITLLNSSAAPFQPAKQAAVWIILYSEEDIGVSHTWVRSTDREPLAGNLPPGASVGLAVDSYPQGVTNWQSLAGVALVEDRPGGAGAYDMIQAAQLEPVSFRADTEKLMLTPRQPEARVVFEGPHVLQWTATADVPWIELQPSSGDPMDDLTVRLLEEERPPEARFATVAVDADGDTMSFTAEIEVSVGGRVRRPRLRLSPDGSEPG